MQLGGAVASLPHEHDHVADDQLDNAARVAVGGVEDDDAMLGAAVEIESNTNDDIIIVGAWGDDDNGSSSGSAYIFIRELGSEEFELEEKLTPPDGQAGDYFGRRVDIVQLHEPNADAYVVVGAPGDDDNGSSAGAAYVYRRHEGGDAAWVTGDFKRLNAQIGSYETYDDALFGVKTFFSMNVLLRDSERSAALSQALTNLQSIEDRLPYESERIVRSEIRAARSEGIV